MPRRKYYGVLLYDPMNGEWELNQLVYPLHKHYPHAFTTLIGIETGGVALLKYPQESGWAHVVFGLQILWHNFLHRFSHSKDIGGYIELNGKTTFPQTSDK